MKALIGQAGLVAGGDLGRRPGLTALRCRLGVDDTLLDPALGEAVVVDAARIPGREEVVGRAQGGDGGQVRGIGSGDGELGEPRVRNTHQTDLVVQHPGLGPDGLDDVVTVVVRGVAEKIEGAARTPRATHLDADAGEAEQGREERADDGGGVRQQRIIRRGLALLGVNEAVGRSRAVPGVLDDRGEGTVGQGFSRREPDGGGDEDAVAHPDVVEASVEVLRRIERRGWRGRGGGEDGEGCRGTRRRPGALFEAVARPRGEIADDQAAERVDDTRCDLGTGAVEQSEPGTGRGPEDVGLVDGSVAVERRRAKRGGGRAGQRDGDDRRHGAGDRHTGDGAGPEVAPASVPRHGPPPSSSGVRMTAVACGDRVPAERPGREPTPRRELARRYGAGTSRRMTTRRERSSPRAASASNTARSPGVQRSSGRTAKPRC